MAIQEVIYHGRPLGGGVIAKEKFEAITYLLDYTGRIQSIDDKINKVYLFVLIPVGVINGANHGNILKFISQSRDPKCIAIAFHDKEQFFSQTMHSYSETNSTW